MSKHVSWSRRQFLGTAATTFAAAELVPVLRRDGAWPSVDANRREFARLIWKSNSPKWAFSDAEFDRTAASFDNPDYVSIVIHNYRWRLSLAEGEPQHAELERRLAVGPVIDVPTITLDGDSDGVTPASDGTSYGGKFSGKRTHRIIKGVGHNLPQEAPKAFADAVIDAAGYR